MRLWDENIHRQGSFQKTNLVGGGVGQSPSVTAGCQCSWGVGEAVSHLVRSSWRTLVAYVNQASEPYQFLGS